MTDHPRDAVEQLLELAGPRRVPADDRLDRARAAARGAWQDEVRRARRGRRLRVAALSLPAALLVLTVVWRDQGSPASDVVVATHNGTPVLLGSVLQTDAATRTALRLISGVEVRLDVNSEVTFEGASAIALTRGGAFVDTGQATGPDRSVEIRTALGTARDIGTRFEVRLIDLPAAAGRRMRVRVRDGIVRVTTSQGAEDIERGIELVAAEGGGMTRAEGPITGPGWDWVTLAAPPFDLDGKTLAEFLAWAAREGGWAIRFSSDALAASASTVVISGTVDGLTPEQALRAVLATCGLTHRVAGDVVTIEAGGAS